jgi:hypothetical protein
MGITIGTAARLTGKDRSTLRRQIKAGKLSATKDEVTGAWMIEPCELERLHPLRPADDTTAAPRAAPGDIATVPLLCPPDALVAELRAVIADLRSDRDAWREQAQRLALPAPGRRTWWRWLRSSA